MTLICFKNGSLAREKIRDQYGLDWNGFNRALASTPPGNNGGILLPWFEAEIVPRVNKPGIHRFDLDERDAAVNCRAVVEAQMMSMRLHSQWMKVAPKRIYATGGASMNTAILQVMADVMNCPVLRIEVAKSAALGAALRGAHGYLVAQASALAKRGKMVGRDHRRGGTGARATNLWQEIVAGFTNPITNSEIKPNRKSAEVYDKLIGKYASCERRVLQACQNEV